MQSPITAKSALLQALMRGDGYGLDLIERVSENTNGTLVLHQGSVYPALRDLEREGFVESYEGEPLPERGGRPRRYYRITADGKRAAIREMHTMLGVLRLNPKMAMRDVIRAYLDALGTKPEVV